MTLNNETFSHNTPLCLGIFPRWIIIEGGYNKETILGNDILLFSDVYHNCDFFLEREISSCL